MMAFSCLILAEDEVINSGQTTVFTFIHLKYGSIAIANVNGLNTVKRSLAAACK